MATEQQLKRAEQLKVHTGIEQRLTQAIENDVDYADPGLTQLLKDALDEINTLNEYCKLKDRLVAKTQPK